MFKVVRFEEGKVITPDGWKDAYRQFSESGWIGLALPEMFGGQGLPKYIAQPVNEMWLSAKFGIRYVSGAGARWLGDSLEICE